MPNTNQDAPMGTITHIEVLPEGFVHLCVKTEQNKDLCCIELTFEEWNLYSVSVPKTEDHNEVADFFDHVNLGS